MSTQLIAIHSHLGQISSTLCSFAFCTNSREYIHINKKNNLSRLSIGCFKKGGPINDTLSQHWIGRTGCQDLAVHSWPPGIAPCDFFLWGCIKVSGFVPPLALKLGPSFWYSLYIIATLLCKVLFTFACVIFKKYQCWFYFLCFTQIRVIVIFLLTHFLCLLVICCMINNWILFTSTIAWQRTGMFPKHKTLIM